MEKEQAKVWVSSLFTGNPITDRSHAIYQNIYFKMKIPEIFSFPFFNYSECIIPKISIQLVLSFVLFLMLGITSKAQGSLVANGIIHRVDFPGEEVLDYIVPEEASGSTIYLRLEGADGSRTRQDSQNSIYGGSGATIEAEFHIGNGNNEIPVGSTIRMIIGGKGGLNSYVGGGGTGLAFKHPNTGQWKLLMVAGGGGGAGEGNTIGGGRSAEITTHGSSGRGLSTEENRGENGEDGGSSEDWARPGRGHLSSTLNGEPVGSNGPKGSTSSSWGFGGGGSRRKNAVSTAGGGGGGYSGGGGGRMYRSGGGGGGASYVNASFAVSETKTKNEGSATDPQDGFIEYRIDCRLARTNEASITDITFESCDHSFDSYIMTIHTDILTSVCDGLTYLVYDGNNTLYNEYPSTRGTRGQAYTVGLAYDGQVIDQMGFTIPKFEWLDSKDFTLTVDAPLTVKAEDVVDIEVRSPEFKFAFLNTQGTSIVGNSKSFDIGTYTEKIGLISPGGKITCQQEVTINILDGIPPVFQSDCVANVYVNITQSLKLQNFDGLIVTDNVTASENIQISWDTGEARYDCADVGQVFQPTIFAEDEQGNISSCLATVHVYDTIRPTIVCQDVAIKLSDEGTATINHLDFIVSASDNCMSETEIISGYSWDSSLLPQDVDCSHIGVYDITLLSSPVGYESNLPSCQARLSILDVTAPLITCRDTTIYLDQGNSGFTQETLPIESLSDACHPNSTLSFTWKNTQPFLCSDIGSDEDAWIEVKDPDNNISRCTFTVTVIDTTTALVTCRDRNINLTGSNNFSYTLRPEEVYTGLTSLCNTIEDRPGILSFSGDSDPLLDCDDLGNPQTLTLIYTPDDGSPASSCNSTITVREGIAPILSCPSGIIGLKATYEDCGALYEYEYTAWDEGCPEIEVGLIEGLPSGSTFPVGWNDVRIQATDKAGNASICAFVVRVDPPSARPTLSCPEDYTVNIEGDACSIIIDTTATFDQTCLVINDQNKGTAMGSLFEVGTHTFGFRTRNRETNLSSECTFKVTVDKADKKPVAVCKEDMKVVLTNGQVEIHPSEFDGGSYDNCYELNRWTLYDENNFSTIIFNCADLGEKDYRLRVYNNVNQWSECNIRLNFVLEEPQCQDITVTLDEAGTASLIPEDIFVPDGNCTSRYTTEIDRSYFDCSDLGTTIVTLTRTAPDDVKQCTANVTVVTPTPTISCQDLSIRLDVSGNASISPTDVFTGSDICGIYDLSLDKTDFTCNDIGETIVTLTATDPNNNTSTCQAAISLSGEVIPEALCKETTVQLNQNGLASISVNDIDNGSNANCGLANLSLDINSFDCTTIGENIVTLTVTDLIGTAGSCLATVTVLDEVVPTALCQNITVQLDENGLASISETLIDNGSNDACGIATLSLDQTNFDCAEVGSNTVTLNATDNNGNTNSCQATVTVADEVAPNVICQDITIQLDENGLASIDVNDINNGTSDACGLANLSIDISAFDCSNVGNNTVTLTATDIHGNTSSCQATVTVADEVAPNTSCQDITVQLDENGLASISETALDNGSSDACGLSNLSIDINAFDCNNVGDNTVTLTVIDNNGNTNTCQATVTIVDEVAAQALCKDHTVQLDENGLANISVNDIDNGTSDACGLANLSIDISAFDCSDVGDNTVTLTATDIHGNTSSCQATVTVADEVAPNVICQDITIQLDENGLASIDVNDINNGTSDACGLANLSIDISAFDCSDVGDNTVTLTTTDIHGNTSSCQATVTVQDEVAPIALCQNITAQLDETGLASISETALDNGSSDACGLSNLSIDINAFDCNNVGDNTVTLTVIDNNGNTNTCQATVTIVDEVAAQALCKDHTVQLDENGLANISVNDIDNGTSDACGLANLFIDISAFDCNDVGDNTVTLTATDIHENTSSCQATITVQDEVAPTALCQNITVQLDENGLASISEATIDNGSSDACGIASMALDQTSFTCEQVGDNTVILTLTDNNGNLNTCEAIVTVVDEIKPSLTCPEDMVVNTDQGECGAYVTLPKAAPADNCGIKNLKSRYRSLNEAGNPVGSWSAWANDQSGFFELGTYQIQWRTKDHSNNKRFCSFILNVIDEEAPEVICTDVMINFNGEATIAIEASTIFDAAASFDACGPVTVASQSISEVSCQSVGETLAIQVVGIDPNGNTSTCVAQVTVGGMPCGFEASDIDCPDGAEATYDPVAESFTLTANDCEGYPDGEYSVVMTELCGDGEIIAKVASLIGDGRAGVIMMESDDPGARFVSKVKDFTPKPRTEYRMTTGGSISNKRKNRSGVKWVRIVRQGNKFKTYTSTNGSFWRSSHTIEYESFADCIQVGMLVYSKNANDPVTAVFENVKVSGDSPSALEQIDGIPTHALQGINERGVQTNLGTGIDLNVAPNPFAIETQIEFTLPKASDVNLEIYNLHGQRVRSLENARLDAGTHRYHWDGNSSKGTSLPTGIYMLRLRADKKWFTTKVSLVNR